jgi:hypothetical protein
MAIEWRLTYSSVWRVRGKGRLWGIRVPIRWVGIVTLTAFNTRTGYSIGEETIRWFGWTKRGVIHHLRQVARKEILSKGDKV